MAWADGSQEPIPEAARRLLAVSAGDGYRAIRVRQSIKQLFALGRFEDVRALVSRTPEGDARLRFELAPRLRIQSLSVRGAPAGHLDALAGIIDLEPGDVPTDLPLRRQAAEEYLREEGWFEAIVEVRAEPAPGGARAHVLARPGPRDAVRSFRAEGVDGTLATRLQRELGALPGRPISESEFEAGIADAERALRERGFLFAVADYELVRDEGPRLDVVLRVEAGPVVELLFEGFPDDHGGAGDVRRRLEANRLDADALEAARQDLAAGLRNAGFRDAVVEVVEEPSRDGGSLRVRFLAAAGERFSVAGVELSGAPPALRAELFAAVEPLGDGEPFREIAWDAALDSLRLTLRRAGHFRAEVAGRTEPAGVPGTLRLTAEVRPGPLARIGSIGFEGNARHETGELEAVAPLRPGDPFVAESVVAARETLQAWYRERGFLEASVAVEAPVHAESHQADVRFVVVEGEFLSVGQIIVAGAEVTRSDRIRDRIALGEGDPLSGEALLETRRRILATGAFSEVDVELLEPEEPVSQRNVLVRVAEAPRNRIGYGAGFSQRERARAEGEWTRSNLFGRYHTLSMFARVSLRGTRFIATYRGAEGFDREVPIFASAYRESQDRESFDFLRYGAGVQLTRRVFGRNLILRHDFTRSELWDLKIDPDEIDRDFAENLWLSTVSASMVVDTRDDPVSPRRGRFGIVDVAWSSAQLGSRAPFVKALGQQFLYFPLSSRVVLAAGGRVGFAATLDDEGPELVPITERFFAGGATTLRGFPLDRAGPLNEGGYPLGGNMLVVANLEARIGLFGSFSGAIFSDHGGVYTRVRRLGFEDVGHSAGVGVRWDTPLGPVRFDYGFRLGDVGDDSRGQWHFTIGHAF